MLQNFHLLCPVQLTHHAVCLQLFPSDLRKSDQDGPWTFSPFHLSIRYWKLAYLVLWPSWSLRGWDLVPLSLCSKRCLEQSKQNLKLLPHACTLSTQPSLDRKSRCSEREPASNILLKRTQVHGLGGPWWLLIKE